MQLLLKEMGSTPPTPPPLTYAHTHTHSVKLFYTEPKIAPNSDGEPVLHRDEVTTSFKCEGLSGGDDGKPLYKYAVSSDCQSLFLPRWRSPEPPPPHLKCRVDRRLLYIHVSFCCLLTK